MRPINEFHHVYVEWHVRFWRDTVGLTQPVRVPKWYAKIWNYPDSTWRVGGSRKTLGYHVGHWTAVLSVLVPLAVLL